MGYLNDPVIVILVGFYFSIAIYLLLTIVFVEKDEKWRKVINPTYQEEETKNKKSKNAFKDKDQKKNVAQKELAKLMKKKDLDRKIKKLYEQAGMKDKNYEFFVVQNLKYITFGFMGAIMTYFLFANLIISFLAFIFLAFLHLIDIYGNISERRSAFREQFPFFLKTLSFVLENGANLAVGFKEVTEKTQDGVLKEVMKDVLLIQKVNGGDFIEAFKHIVQEIEIDETKEFVDIVQNNYEKGIPVAETFSIQSETMAKYISNKKQKKVNNIENKVLIPILAIFGALVLLAWGAIM